MTIGDRGRLPPRPRSASPRRHGAAAGCSTDPRNIVKITTSTKTPDAEQLRRINEVTDRLVAEHGYCPLCANELVRYVGQLLGR